MDSPINYLSDSIVIYWGNLSLSKIIGRGWGPRTAASLYCVKLCKYRRFHSPKTFRDQYEMLQEIDNLYTMCIVCIYYVFEIFCAFSNNVLCMYFSKIVLCIKVTRDSFIIHKLDIINCRLLFEGGRRACDEELARNPHCPPHPRW